MSIPIQRIFETAGRPDLANAVEALQKHLAKTPNIDSDSTIFHIVESLEELQKLLGGWAALRQVVDAADPPNDQVHKTNLDRMVAELPLSVRMSNCLAGTYDKRAECTYIGDLVQKTGGELLSTKNFGRKGLRQIEEVLATMGLSLGMKVEGWQRPTT